MKKIFTLLITFFFSFCFCQKKCELKIDYDSSTIKNDGNIKIIVKNIGVKKTKILKNFHPYKVQILNTSIYSKEENKYLPKNFGTADIDFFKPEKTVKIKPNQTKIYIINIFETFQGTKYLTRQNDIKFDLYFDFITLIDYRCECEIIGNNKIENLKYKIN